jgi:hypothetical protein
LAAVVAAIPVASHAALIHQYQLDETSLTFNGSVYNGILDTITGDSTGQLFGYAAGDAALVNGGGAPGTVVARPGPAGYGTSYDFANPPEPTAATSGVNTPYANFLPSTTNFTLTAVFNTTQNLTGSAQVHLVSNNTSQSGRNNLGIINNTADGDADELFYFANNGLGGANGILIQGLPTGVTLNDGNWHTAQVSRDGNLFTLALDGQVIGTQSSTGLMLPATGSTYIFGRGRSGGSDYDGSIAEVNVDDTNLLPEPASLSLLALGGFSLRRRRRN